MNPFDDLESLFQSMPEDMINKMFTEHAKYEFAVYNSVQTLDFLRLMGEQVQLVTMPMQVSVVLNFDKGIKSQTLYRNLIRYMNKDYESSDNISIECCNMDNPDYVKAICCAIFRSN